MGIKKQENISLEEARKQVAELIFKVLTKTLCVREAIKLFPAEIYDPSVVCAWHALVHFDADEDLKKHDMEYAEEQNNYLEMMAFTLQNGNALPQNMLDDYEKYHDEALIPRKKGIISWFKSLLKFTI
ncbi:MAG: hypothetical protein PHC34_06965 [Candidatus Gastranaerophilales bacterium]|nr:hypothetical protein [Candidatus Gastranaerophilales bacterium]